MSAPAGSSSSGGAVPSGGPGPGGGGGVPPGPPGFYGLGPQAPMPGLSPEQFALLLAQVGGAKEKDPVVEDRVISRFRFGATDKSPLIKVWPGAPINISDDIVTLFRAGNNIPLSLLTVAAINDFRVHVRRSSFQPKMSGRLLDEFQSWHNRDDYLPFPEWSQAFHSLVQMWRHFRPPVPDEDPNEDPVQHFVEHFLIVEARITSQNWPIWREYDKRIRRIIWADAASEQSINFVPSKLNTSILADAEVTITSKMGSASDFTTIQDSAWWAIVSASGSDIVKLGKKFADSVTRAISAIRSPPVSPSSKDKGKRKREDDQRPGPSEPFRGGDSRGGDGRSSVPYKPLGLNRPLFCIICCCITAEHGWQGCKRPANNIIQRQGAGWIWPGAKVGICGKFNAGQEELGSICLYGHYCSQCGKRGHRAIEHGIASEAVVEAFAYIPDSIRNGFSMGPLKAPSSSHFWPNQYPPEHQGIIDEWIEDARRSTFIAGPFDPDQVKAVIGHVRASPVLLVQKLDEHGVVVKNRVVYNASHPRTSKLEPPPPIPSINSQINKADYPCLWMTAVETKHMFRKKLEAAYKDGALLSLKDIASLIGSCQHTCVLAMNRRSKLNALYTLRNSYRFQHPSASKHLPTNARAEVKDWLIFFNQGPISCRLDLPTSLFPMQLYTDASDFGVGIVLGSLLVSFPLPNDYTDRPGINIGVGEAWAFELGVYAAIEHGAQDCLLTVYVDNQGIVFAARRGRSRNDLANDAIDRAADAALAANVDLSIIYPLRRLLSDQQLLVPTPVASSSTLASSRPRRSLASGSRVSSSSTTSSASIPRSSSLPSLSRAEIANQALESRAHAIAFIGSLAGSDVGSFLSTADVFLSLSEDNVPTADLSAAAADALAREDIMVKLSPALHLVQAVHGSMSPHAIQQLRTFKAHRVSLDTRKGYGGHVLAFLRWADDLDHPAHLRFPIPPTIVMLFFQSSAPFYAESTLGKVYSALQCWHAIHSLPCCFTARSAAVVLRTDGWTAALPLPLKSLNNMSDVEDTPIVDAPEVETADAAPAPKGALTIEEAVQEVLKKALIHDGLARGLRECAKALDRRQAHLCVLVETCTEAEYIKLIEALCNEHKIDLLKVSDPKLLGTWAGLCKIDREGNPRKVVGCSCVVVRDYGEESEGLNVLLEYFKNRA
ncbi:unnamed protein product [Tilletia controversa]|nr:unnamed protein product [Tilletia controversa]